MSVFLLSSCGSGDDSSVSERLANEVYGMRQCQRRADNLNFYLHKYQADKILERRGESKEWRESKARYAIVYSDYLLQIGNRAEARKVLDNLHVSKDDTLLWLNTLAHHGQANFYPYNIRKHSSEIEKGYDNLIQCYIFSSRNNIELYKAVSMQILSQYLLNDSIFLMVRNFDAASIRYINEDAVPDSLLAGNLAERALHILLNHNDFFLTASAWNSLASCYFRIGDASKSIQCLNNALANPAIDSMPDLKATLSEQMSMSYAALDDKHMSDVYRNQYLDLQDSTRQDRFYEARLISLERNTHRIWMIVGVAFAVFIMLCLLSYVLMKLRHRLAARMSGKYEVETMREELAALRLQCSDARRAMVEQRARVSIIKGILPLIERMRLALKSNDKQYMDELLHDIDSQNNMLTQWIKLNQGKVKPRIEVFPLSDIFSMVEGSSSSLAYSGISLDVKPISVSVKADRSLTLFIVNTLIDNARKAKPTKISLSAEPTDGGVVTISVADDGCGMTEEQVIHLFDIKPVVDDAGKTSHGFGLQNCRGIIERYRKISNAFSACRIEAQSQLGKGTKIVFTLPRVMIIVCMMLLTPFMSVRGGQNATDRVERLADSLYQCNVEGRFAEASLYADSCRLITGNKVEVADREAYTYLSIYNETAVTALALHQWSRYRYYNHLYSQLYKRTTADKQLPSYCIDKERGELMANIAMLVVLLLILSLLPLLWFLLLRPLLRQRRETMREKERLRDDTARLQREYSVLHVGNNIVSNQLSTIKHETMYYPTRISQLVSHQGDDGELDATVGYYSALYSMLCSNMLEDEKSSKAFPVRKLQLDDTTTIMVNEELFAYLQLLLKRHNGGQSASCEVQAARSEGQGARYVSLSYPMPSSDITPSTVELLFTNGTPHTDYLVMRQIVRETADATNAYGCGIKGQIVKGIPAITVTLPRAL